MNLLYDIPINNMGIMIHMKIYEYIGLYTGSYIFKIEGSNDSILSEFNMSIYNIWQLFNKVSAFSNNPNSKKDKDDIITQPYKNTFCRLDFDGTNLKISAYDIFSRENMLSFLNINISYDLILELYEYLKEIVCNYSSIE